MKAQVLSFPNKRSKEEEIYNKSYDKWLHINRANDGTKKIASEAITIIAACEFLFLKNDEEIIIDYDFLIIKTHKQNKQNKRFLSQLADIYDVQYHYSYIYKGKKRRNIFAVKRTENSLQILSNPLEFYKNQLVKNDNLTGQKSPLKWSNLTTSIYKELDKYRQETREISKDNISLVSEENNARAENETTFPAATGFLDEPAAVNEFLPTSIAEEPPKLMTAEEEKRRERDHNHRAHDASSTIENPFVSLMAKVFASTKSREDIGDLQPRVEIPPDNSSPGALINSGAEAKTEPKEMEEPLIKPPPKEIDQDLQKVIDRAVGMYEHEIDQWDIKWCLKELNTARDECSKTLCFSGNPLVIKALRKQHWKVFTKAFYETLPDYTFEFIEEKK